MNSRKTPNPLPDDKISNWSKLKQSADDIFEFDVNSRNFSKLVENPLGKGVFKRLVSQGRQKGAIVREWVNHFPNNPCFLRVCSTSLLKTLWEKERLLTMSSILLQSFLPFSKILKL